MVRLITITLLLWGISPYCLAMEMKSAAHLGYSMERESSTGFGNSAGSMFFLDISIPLIKNMEFGLRTVGSGGRSGSGEFYRLEAGPLFNVLVTENWLIHASFGRFNETAVAPSGSYRYKSSGEGAMFGWERLISCSDSMKFTFGGFIARHWGDVTSSEYITAIEPNRKMPKSKINIGSSQGIEMGVKLSL